MLRRISWALVLALVVLELLLQVGAFVASSRPAAAPAAGAGAPILCVGDSYTYGLGATASEHSYPGELQAALQQRLGAAAPAVVNAGWPGQNSREALLRLDALLEQKRPQLVCVLIGLNDTWTRPAAVSPAELADGLETGFVWRCRSWRLLQLLWQRESVPVAPSGLGATAAAPTETAAPSGSFEVASEAVALVRAGKPAAAIARLERAIQDDPANAPEFHQGLVQIHTASGQRERAVASLTWLRDRYQAAPSGPVAEALATSLHAIGEREQAAVFAEGALRQFPDTSTLWWILSQFHYDTGKLAAAEGELDRAIATAQPRNRDWLASLHRDLARACCDRDLAKAVRAMLAAMHLDHDVERCRLVVDGAPQAFGREALQRCIADLAPAAPDLELLQRLFGNGWADRSGVQRVLEQHLRSIVQRCRARGTKVVLLGYPLPVDDLTEVQRGVAAALQVPFVPCLPAFAAALQGRRREELYVRDGHCTDAGYALMAATALPGILQLLQ